MSGISRLLATIFIASNSLDAPTTDRVVKKLRKNGYEVISYESDMVASGQHELTIKVEESGDFYLAYRGHSIKLSDIAAAWYRRPDALPIRTAPSALQTTKDERYKQICQITVEQGLDLECTVLERSIWSQIPEATWLNSPANIRKAEDKLLQLSLAAQLGFTIPETTVSNHWQQVAGIPNEKLIVKPMTQQLLYRHVRDTIEERVVYTTKIPNDPAKFPNVLPYPGIWQPYVEKRREWRVTVVGEQVFAAAVYTDKDAKDDWRKHQMTPKVAFRIEEFPEELKKKCVTFLKRMNLIFGAFDFIETPDGKILFLELNPNGQYGWLERELKLPLSDAIADELIRIAKTR